MGVHTCRYLFKDIVIKKFIFDQQYSTDYLVFSNIQNSYCCISMGKGIPCLHKCVSNITLVAVAMASVAGGD